MALYKHAGFCSHLPPTPNTFAWKSSTDTSKLPTCFNYSWSLLLIPQHISSAGTKAGKIKPKIYKNVAPVANTEPCVYRLTFYCLLQNILPCRLFSSPSFWAGSYIQSQDLLSAWPPTLKSLILLKHSPKVVWIYLFHKWGTKSSRNSPPFSGEKKKKRKRLIWMKASDKKEAKNILLLYKIRSNVIVQLF